MAKGLSLTVAAALAAAGPIAMAQSPPGSFEAGPGYVYPEIELAVQRDDNIALQPDATRVSDTISYARPSFRVEAKSGVQNYDAGYRGEYARYNSVTSDNHDDHEVFAGGDWTPDARSNFRLKGQYLDKVDPRGVLPVVTPTPNEYRQRMLTGFYAYGAQDAAGKLELQAGGYSKTYLSDQPQIKTLDHSRTELGASLLLRVLPKTYATLSTRQYRYDYTEAGSTKDSQETFLFAGLRWNVSAVTSGRINFGSQTKKFESASGAATTEYSGGAWEGGLTWKPLFYSSVDLVTQKRTGEATGVGDFVVNQTHLLTWTHAWGSRVTTILTTAYSKDRYFGAGAAVAGGQNREDSVGTGGIRVLYAVQRWLKFGADYAVSTRNSNDDNFDYRRNQFMLLANFTL
jgi:hypothetical protein